MRSHRWQVGVVGWSAALVLLVGAGALVAGVLDEEPVVTAAPAVVVEPAVKTPVVAPVRVPAPEGPIDPDLGPPPGPYDDVEPTARAAPADRWAFLVGMQDYRPPTRDTTGSAADVRFIRQQLVEAGWLPQNIRTIVDSEVSGDAIRAGLAWLADRGRPGTFSLFHYSGHVKQLGGGTEALWPVDRDFVRDTEVTAAMAGVDGKLWVDIAGCEAGSFLPGLPSDRVLFSGSSKGTEKSYEYPDWGMSVWTGLVFLRSPVEADADRDGTVVIGEALRYSRYYAQVITKTQEPYGRQTPQVEGDMVRGWTLDSPPA